MRKISRFSQRLIVGIPAARKDAANQWCRDNLGVEGDTFSVGLSTTGNAPVQAYWCSWQLTPEQFDLLRGYAQTLYAAGVRWYDADTWTPEAVLADRNLKVIQPAL